MSRHVTSCPVMSRHVISCYVISRRKSRDGHATNTSLSTDFFQTQSIRIKHDRVRWLSRRLPIQYRISGIWSILVFTTTCKTQLNNYSINIISFIRGVVTTLFQLPRCLDRILNHSGLKSEYFWRRVGGKMYLLETQKQSQHQWQPTPISGPLLDLKNGPQISISRYMTWKWAPFGSLSAWVLPQRRALQARNYATGQHYNIKLTLTLLFKQKCMCNEGHLKSSRWPLGNTWLQKPIWSSLSYDIID